MTSLTEAMMAGMAVGMNAVPWIVLLLEVLERVKDAIMDIGSERK